MHTPPAEHVPGAPQTPPPEGHAASAVPAYTFAQVPLGWPVSALEQARHVPVHAESQQKPSAQEPLVHSAAPAQVLPVTFFATHAAALQ